MTETNPFDNGDWQKTIDLPTGCRVRVDETRSVVQLPFPKTRGDCNGNATPDVSTGDNNTNAARRRWKAISSAIWNGGLRSFDPESTKTSDDPNTSKTDRAALVHVFNYKVPSTYDGLNPEPKAMLRTAISNEFSAASEPSNSFDEGREDKDSTTIGIMTAASMRSLRTATRSAGGVVVDAIVTAGISNARAAGASADFFGILPPEATQQPEKEERPPPGTINTVVVINGASLTEEAMIEAYAITIEAKCGACADYSIACAKNTQKLAQGTGTDCAVLLCPSNDAAPVSYSGKHCLLAELIGQAVREATAEAIRSNLDYFHGGSLSKYHASRCLRFARGILKGARPCVPAKPMDPVPGAPPAVLGLGTFLVLFCYGLCVREFLPRPATILLAAFAWDRCLPEPPLSVHPVVLAGTTISLATNRWIPAVVFERQRPVLGFCAGLLFLVGTLSLFVMGAHGFLSALRWTETTVTAATFDSQSTNQYLFSQHSLVMVSWVLEVLLFKTTFSLQLLCTIALQMAGFLERSQMQEARAQLSWLCSRDPTHLNSEELAGGTLESLSENLSDGTVAPWFWYVLLGPVGALGYRVANTLDSRIGYRGGRYEWFGKASARFDDLINLIPARLTALLLCVASYRVDGCSPSRGLHTALHDRRQCSSPNAGWPMGAMAGILGVKLGKRGEYCLGKDLPGVRGPTPSDIRRGHGVTQLAGAIALVAAVVACGVREWMSAAN